MNKDRSALLKKVSKTLALGVPVVALSGFLPGANFAVSDAAAEGDSYSSEAKSEAKSKAKEPLINLEWLLRESKMCLGKAGFAANGRRP